jgi:hypothetical protein
MKNKSKKILSEISAGELLDKISILEIKLQKIKDKSSQIKLKKEYKILKKNQNLSINLKGKMNIFFKNLKVINLKLWNVEDKLRICEKNKTFNKVFVKLAREVYFYNDKRAEIKLNINNLFGSNIVEVKQYVNY